MLNLDVIGRTVALGRRRFSPCLFSWLGILHSSSRVLPLESAGMSSLFFPTDLKRNFQSLRRDFYRDRRASEYFIKGAFLCFLFLSEHHSDKLVELVTIKNADILHVDITRIFRCIGLFTFLEN